MPLVSADNGGNECPKQMKRLRPRERLLDLRTALI